MDFHTILDLSLPNPANSSAASYVYKPVVLDRSFARGGVAVLSNALLEERTRICHQ
ncbi:Uncharacterized protein BM_BM13312 [Brugia malayi]|uniref:Bm13312 n=2 Tax=Brugia TaxID=6278 RepID=A0A0K0IXG4_BRUMA|nr:Uncharacterized protein BM_BM13312 [Brugia malayi]CRZ26016.1 Bm13312 [Brugia malayi]VDO12789.1 unnamed protein product [Brugia timori]VIO86638.1 Uncharacterized protein BM_BM13312 [Brugia malayi]